MVRPHYTPIANGRRPAERIAACGAVALTGTDCCGVSRVIYVRCRECVRLMRKAFRVPS